MEQDVLKPQVRNQETQIEFVKKWVVDLYETGVFYSFSLHTLELSRRFQSLYRKYRNTKIEADFQELFQLAEKLEKKLVEEKRV